MSTPDAPPPRSPEDEPSSTASPEPAAAAQDEGSALRSAIEFGPGLAFLVGYIVADIWVATVAIMVAAPLALLAGWILEKRLPIVPMVTTGVVLLFGSLALFVKDEAFIKIKPTITYGVLASILFVGLLTGRSLVEPVLGSAIRMDAAGWRKLSLRVALSLLAIAGLNEIVWRTQSTDVWMGIKTFGFPILLMVVLVGNTAALKDHMLDGAEPGSGPEA